MNNQNKKSISKILIGKIEKGEVKMRPRLYFVLKGILVLTGAFIIIATILYLISFILFVLQRSGLWFLPRYGLGGIRLFLVDFPWIILLVTVFFIILLELLVRKYAIVYRKPLLYSFLAIIFIVSFIGFIVHQTSFQGRIYLRAQKGKIPFASLLYNKFETLEPDRVHPGTIYEITDKGFMIERYDGEFLEVVVSPDTRLSNESDIEKDAQVAVIGDLEKRVIRAIGVHKIPNGKNRFPFPKRPIPERPRMKKPKL